PCPQSVLVVRSTPPPLRILPSFPTRRSSDLEEVTGSIPVSRTEQAPGTPPGASCIRRRPRGADERATCGCCVAGLEREHHADRDPFASRLVLYTTAITSEHLCLLLRTPTDRATVHPVRIRTVRTRTTNRRARPTTATTRTQVSSLRSTVPSPAVSSTGLSSRSVPPAVRTSPMV